MGYTDRHQWHDHYAQGKGFRPLGDSERDLLAEHLPPRPGAAALEIGCGTGELARYLADLGYAVTGVDYADSAIAACADAAPVNSNMAFVCMDVESDDWTQLPDATYDLVICRLSYAFVVDRGPFLARVRDRLRPGGALCVITPLHRDVPEDRRDIALDDNAIDRLTAGWREAARYDADGLAVITLRHPQPHPSSFRVVEKGTPTPRALVGVSVIVTNEHGQVLLGQTAEGCWECPGGKTAGTSDGGPESFEATAVRELREETTLDADEVRILAVLLDSSHGIPRLTVAAHVCSFRGTASVAEPHLFRVWRWFAPERLPDPLFTPSAQVLAAWRPHLLTGLPSVHRYPLAPTQAGPQ